MNKKKKKKLRTMSVVLIDGGLGTELTNMGYSTEVTKPFNHPIIIPFKLLAFAKT